MRTMIPSLPVVLALLQISMASGPVADPESASSHPPEGPPPVVIGCGYYAILPHKLLLASQLRPDWKDAGLSWTKVSGPGEVKIERPNAATTWATADQPGKYAFQLTATLTGREPFTGTVRVNVYPPGAYTGNPILPGMFPDPT